MYFWLLCQRPTTIATKKIGNAKVKNTVLQSAFFSLANILPKDEAIDYMKKAAYKSFAKKGEEIVNMNYAAIERGAGEVIKVDVPAAWADAEGTLPVSVATGDRKDLVDFVNNVAIPTLSSRLNS